MLNHATKTEPYPIPLCTISQTIRLNETWLPSPGFGRLIKELSGCNPAATMTASPTFACVTTKCCRFSSWTVEIIIANPTNASRRPSICPPRWTLYHRPLSPSLNRATRIPVGTIQPQATVISMPCDQATSWSFVSGATPPPATVAPVYQLTPGNCGYPEEAAVITCPLNAFSLPTASRYSPPVGAKSGTPGTLHLRVKEHTVLIFLDKGS
mmetsp:Transcript_16359/g.42474  ORF Transcript_16359/g.42474 Transcript_16359/m.42474 type:complete len:211 (-) Transcript_16359:1544-2176(-)